MSSDPITWIVAGLEIVLAVGIVVFWIGWFRQPHDEPWLPEGYVEHEFPFVVTDSVLAILLVVAAAFQIAEHEAGASLGLIAAGMLAFLGILDLVYFARNGMFKREHDGVCNVVVVAGVLTLSVILIARFF